MIDATRIALEPFTGWPLFWLVIAATALAWLAYLVFRGRAALLRGAGLTLLAAALSNPSLVREEREPLPSVAAVIIDRSESMQFGNRQAAADAALAAIKTKLDADKTLEVRYFETDPSADGSYLYGALESLMADVPRDRIAGAIFITDGQVHDLPSVKQKDRLIGPLHGIIVGDPGEGDRRIAIVDGPSFGIVGETAELRVLAEDPSGGDVTITVSVNGDTPTRATLPAGTETRIPVKIERRGENIVVLETSPGKQELTLANNRTAAAIAGVRDRLRVLLITGRPNQAGRTWRDLLKSDPSVDLVHFTILRPDYKLSDPTPDEELALIQFPTEELFEQKLKEFDLLIFDQYERTGIVSESYLANMARFVAEGGALLIADGEPFAGPASLARSPLASVLPASPTGRIRVGSFKPQLTEAGRRHSVTQTLGKQSWGGWLRYVEASADTGDVLMQAPDGHPLLIVDRVEDGRIGMLLSDQIWLWARGYDGGGPFAELIRRTVHWLMKEPELEERRLTLSAEENKATMELRTLSDTAPPLTLETPEGARRAVPWTTIAPGHFKAETPIDQLGLYRASSGGLEAVALNGPANPKEYASLQSTSDVMQPISKTTNGGVFRAGADGRRLPDIRRTGKRGDTAGNNWLGLREAAGYAVRASESQALLPGILAAAAILALLLAAWWREGR
jgi:hypothetical protein